MSYITGTIIKELREKQHLTQKELANKIMVSDKTISKWETEKGLPDVGIIEDLASALGISVADLLTGEYRENENVSANMKKLHFYICPICGNIITAVGAGSFSCCGIKLLEQEAESDQINELNQVGKSNQADEPNQTGRFNQAGESNQENVVTQENVHKIKVETVDEEYHVYMEHEMKKKHYISFLAYVTSDSVEIKKLYPEQEISVRFRKKGHGELYAYCNRHGLVKRRV